jgi:CDP-glucose 4,6-dehydratase
MERMHRKEFGNFYAGKTVLITGHTGFKGSWLALWLELLGAAVIGFSLEPPTTPSHFESLRLKEHISHIIGDIREQNQLEEVFRIYKPEIVFHLAAQSLVRHSYVEPHLTYETNVMGTINVLEAVRKNSYVRVVVNITSDKCYDNKEWDYAYRENDAMGGFDPYSSSKGCAELVAAAYRNSFFHDRQGTRLASVRAGNVVGGGDWAEDRIIPDCIRALKESKPIIVRNPSAIRPWQHVLEPLSGYLWLARQMWNSGSCFDSGWNFGPNAQSNIKVKQIVEKVISVWGSGSWQGPNDSVTQPHEAKFLKLDCSKASTLLDWHPVLGIDETIQFTTAWFMDFYNDRNETIKRSTLDIANYVFLAQTQHLIWAGDIIEEESEHGE